MEKTISKVFEQYYRKYAKGIFRYIYFKVSGYEVAQDITSDVFVRYWKILSQGSRIKNHKAMLYFIARGRVIDTYRKKNTQKISLHQIDERLLGVLDTVEQTLSQKQDIEAMYVKITALKKEYQDVLFLHYVEDLSVKEIAYIQKKKENATRVLLHRATQALKKKYDT